MNAAERFNATVERIEELVWNEEYSSSEIGNIVSRENGRSMRDMSAIFIFLTDMALGEYISGRKLNAAYYALTDGENIIAEAVGIAGYSDQPAFTRAFKKAYGMTPKEAMKKKDKSLLTDPIRWEDLAGGKDDAKNDPEPEEDVDTKIFGLSEGRLEKVEKALELEAFYGFSRMFSNYAFDLSKKTGRSLEDCFRYAASLRDFGGNFDGDKECEQTPEELLHECGDVKEYQELFFKKGLSVELSSELFMEYNFKYEDLLACDPFAIMNYPGFEPHVEIAFAFYLKACKYYSQFYQIAETKEQFAKYIDQILQGRPMEIAFTEAEEEMEMEADEDIGDPFDIEDEEIVYHNDDDDFSGGERFDDDLEYDPDNAAFDQYDKDDRYNWMN